MRMVQVSRIGGPPYTDSDEAHRRAREPTDVDEVPASAASTQLEWGDGSTYTYEDRVVEAAKDG